MSVEEIHGRSEQSAQTPKANRLTRLHRYIAHAAHLLPAQGPITVFIHHNTLHAFEDLPFTQAVRQGGKTFGCEPFLTEDRYRTELARGRIRFDELRQVVLEDLGGHADDSLLGLASRVDLRLAMLQHPVWSGPLAELLWFIGEADALRQFRPGVSSEARGRMITETRRWVMRDLRGRHSAPPWATDLLLRFQSRKIESWNQATWEAFTLEALWQVCREGVSRQSPKRQEKTTPLRHRDLLLAVASVDTDQLVHDLLVRFCASFLDQGMSHWQLPHRDRGLYQSFLTLYRRRGGSPEPWLRDLPTEAARLQDAAVTPSESVVASLEALGIPEAQWEDYLSQTLLALRGWGGMILQMEQRGDRVAHPVPEGTLVEFLAVRLLLDRLAIRSAAAEELDYTGSLETLHDWLQQRLTSQQVLTTEQRAFPLFRLAQVLGWSPAELNRLTPGEWALLLGEFESFDGIERRRVFHQAYERRFVTQSLDALALHTRHTRSVPARPRFQVLTCLDEREESFRRHIEEVAPDAETFGVAGFFAVVMYYRGAADARFIPLCPIVVQPRHWVEEHVCGGHELTHQRRAQARKTLGAVAHRFNIGTRSFALGAIISAGLGVLASVPLVARILFPRLAARVNRHFGHYVRTPPATRLNLERAARQPGPSSDQQGYNLDEMSAIAERLLQDIGLKSNFARLVIILGHGSDSLNNPHRSAYDCGACGGSPGAPNARAVAQILNDPRVRRNLGQRGIDIPDDTWFVGGFHNTCDDSVTLADSDRVSESHRTDLEQAKAHLDEACNRNAHERCRRFMSAPLDLPFAEARLHVENRSEDMAQTRPELGHATNALCVVGRRERTRGLFLDRRAFLTSYDPTQDSDGSILARILAAVVPVCGGINLEYYFSHVDNQGYGCGTKLPHNITSLLGVMDGAASDLRTGLPWQMVEIHEPVRLLFIVETTPQTLLDIMEQNPAIGRLVRNGWVHVATLSPTTTELRLFRDGSFQPYAPSASELPVAPTSSDWYRGWREHLYFAQVGN